MNFLEPLFLSKKKLTNYHYLLLIAFAFILFSICSYFIGKSVSLDGDFNVFWQAGKNFSNGVSLYSQIGGAERFIYPPFAAMCFQFFGLFSLHQAGAIFCFFNFLFWLMIIYYSQQMLLFYGFNDKQIKYALLVAFVLSFRYFLYHIKFIQMNEIVLLMSLAGIHKFLHHKKNTAITLLVIATFLKIIPVLILILILSRCNYKQYITAFLCFVLCLLLPFLFRGIAQSTIDLHEYYISFLAPFQHGRVEPKLQNYGLEAALYKLFSTTENGTKYNYIVAVLSPETINLIYKSIIGLLLIAFAIIVWPFRQKKQLFTLHDICFVLLFTHLLSGITWEYHLVTMFFVIAVLTIDYLTTKSKYKWMYYFLGIILLFNSIIGMDTVGKYLYYKSCGYSLLTWLLLILAIYFFEKYFSSIKKAVQK